MQMQCPIPVWNGMWMSVTKPTGHEAQMSVVPIPIRTSPISSQHMMK